MRSEAAGVLPEAFWSPFGPLIHRKRVRGALLVHRRSPRTMPGDQRGTTENHPRT
jgi:hypothetical protein